MILAIFSSWLICNQTFVFQKITQEVIPNFKFVQLMIVVCNFIFIDHKIA